MIRKTRTKTSIRYAKENDRETERERKKGRRINIEREGEIRDIERGERDRESEREPFLSKTNPLPNAFSKLCERFPLRE